MNHEEVILEKLISISNDLKYIKAEREAEGKEEIRFREQTIAGFEALQKADESHERHFQDLKEETKIIVAALRAEINDLKKESNIIMRRQTSLETMSKTQSSATKDWLGYIFTLAAIILSLLAFLKK